MFAYDIRVKLNEFSPDTWRDLIIPENYTFKDLLDIINMIWGFSGDEDSLFILRPSHDVIMDASKSNDFNVKYDAGTTEVNVLFDDIIDLVYLYDMKDRWQIGIQINAKIDYDKDYATVVAFKGAFNPLEKCGGVWELSEIIYYANNPSKRDSSKNAKLSLKVKKFNITQTNEKLKNFK